MTSTLNKSTLADSAPTCRAVALAKADASLRLSGIRKPRKIVVPLAIGLAWQPDPNYIYQEKIDGVFAVQEIRSEELGISILAGEQMRSGEFYAFDCLQYAGADVRGLPLHNRLWFLDQCFLSHSNTWLLPPHLRRVSEAIHGGEFLRTVLARGGEGIMRKHRNSIWPTLAEACKRLETFHCQVTGIGPGQSVQISRMPEAGSQNTNSQLLTSNSSSPAGRVKLGGGKCDRIRVGSILKIEGFGLTTAGKIREPRPCQDTPTSWLVKF